MLYKLLFELLYSIDNYFEEPYKPPDPPKMLKRVSFSTKPQYILIEKSELPTIQQYIYNWNECKKLNNVEDTPEEEVVLDKILDYKTCLFDKIKKQYKNSSSELISDIAMEIAISCAIALHKDTREIDAFLNSSNLDFEQKYLKKNYSSTTIQFTIETHNISTVSTISLLSYDDSDDENDDDDSDDYEFGEIEEDELELERVKCILNKQFFVK